MIENLHRGASVALSWSWCLGNEIISYSTELHHVPKTQIFREVITIFADQVLASYTS